jgi:predicted Fe-Mo cluster-binding NifX family protein
MKLAVTFENGQVFQHFGQTQQFKIYDIEDGKITMTTVVNTNGDGHGALAGFLKKLNVDTLICGGIGAGAKQALAEACIKLYGGVSGDIDKAVAAFLAGKLLFDSELTCDHHGETHRDACGKHGCGEHH